MLIDSHCHLDYDYSPRSEEDVVRDAQTAGVSHLVTIGTDRASLAKVAAISERHQAVYHTVGIHPHEAIDFTDEDEGLLLRAAGHPKCLAIGEIGLDTHYDHSPPEIQREVFERQLGIALQAELPIVIHSREAEDDLVAGLKRYCARLKPGALPGVIHCFTGSRSFGEACLELGFYISFSGILTFKNAEGLRESARAFPLERLLVETDSPYLAPVPHRGSKCEPAMIHLTAEKLAEIKGVSFEEIAHATSANAIRVFRIPSLPNPA